MEATKRRWFRFSLRTMFVLVTVLCVWLGYELNRIRSRKSLVAKISDAGGEVICFDRQTWRTRYLGDIEPDVISFKLGFKESHYDLLVQAHKYFPTIGFNETWEKDGESFGMSYTGNNGEFPIPRVDF